MGKEIQQFIRYLESDSYKEWFSKKVIKMFLKILKEIRDEDLSLDEFIEILEENLDLSGSEHGEL